MRLRGVLIVEMQSSISELSKKFGYLPYMIERYLSFLGLDDTIKLLKANERPLKPSIRLNLLKMDLKDLKLTLEKKGIELEPIELIDHGFNVLKSSINLGSSHEFLQGYYYLQNVASMFPPIILNPSPTEVVLDMCAAPGGKATHLAQLMENTGTLILCERNRKRIPALTYNLRRMGVINSILFNMDASNVDKLNIKPDKILLDAPCTGEGLIREDPTRKKSRNLEDIQKMAEIQKILLKKGLQVLKPRGKLLYCTCSIAPEENEMVVHNVLKNTSGYDIESISQVVGVEGITRVYGEDLLSDLKHARRLYPHVNDTIGFFMCLIKKR